MQRDVTVSQKDGMNSHSKSFFLWTKDNYVSSQILFSRMKYVLIPEVETEFHLNGLAVFHRERKRHSKIFKWNSCATRQKRHCPPL